MDSSKANKRRILVAGLLSWGLLAFLWFLIPGSFGPEKEDPDFGSRPNPEEGALSDLNGQLDAGSGGLSALEPSQIDADRVDLGAAWVLFQTSDTQGQVVPEAQLTVLLPRAPAAEGLKLFTNDRGQGRLSREDLHNWLLANAGPRWEGDLVVWAEAGGTSLGYGRLRADAQTCEVRLSRSCWAVIELVDERGAALEGSLYAEHIDGSCAPRLLPVQPQPTPGFWRVGGLPAGDSCVKLVIEGRAAAVVRLIGLDPPIQRRVELANGSSFEVRVCQLDGHPIAGAKVAWSSRWPPGHAGSGASATTVSQVVSDASGYAHLSNIEPGLPWHELTVEAAGFEAYSNSRPLVGNLGGTTVRLVAAAQVELHWQGNNTEQLAGLVRLKPLVDSEQRETPSAFSNIEALVLNGRARLSGLPTGVGYLLELRAGTAFSSRVLDSFQLAPFAGSESRVVARDLNLASLDVMLMLNGKPLHQGMIAVVPDDDLDGRAVSTLLVSSSGVTRFAIPSGRYRAIARLGGLFCSEKVELEEYAQCTLELGVQSKATGRLVDGDGNPIGGRILCLESSQNTTCLDSTTSADGAFELVGWSGPGDRVLLRAGPVPGFRLCTTPPGGICGDIILEERTVYLRCCELRTGTPLAAALHISQAARTSRWHKPTERLDFHTDASGVLEMRLPVGEFWIRPLAELGWGVGQSVQIQPGSEPAEVFVPFALEVAYKWERPPVALGAGTLTTRTFSPGGNIDWSATWELEPGGSAELTLPQGTVGLEWIGADGSRWVENVECR